MVNLEDLANFLVKAKVNAWAGDGREILPQRPGFKELEFIEGDWEYRDSYTGYYYAPGQEVVRFKGRPVWTMAYSGGMKPEYHGNREFAKQTFAFLKEALKLVKPSMPFRGPLEFKHGDFEYRNRFFGDIKCFTGFEIITYKGKEVFRQDYVGGLVVSKNLS